MSRKYFYSLRARLSLLLVITAAACLIIDFCGKPIFLVNETIYWFLLVLLMFVGAYKFFQFDLPKQKIHNQPSWVYYFYWAFAWLFLPIIFVCIFKTNLIDIKTLHILNCFIFLGVYLMFLLLSIVAYNKFKPREFNDNFRFSPHSVGLGQDDFQFEASAKNVAKGMLSLNDYVNVISLHGEAGGGKSSYARMIIESLDKKKILYSYISLTETNEGKDFSKLFSERWHEALSTRYPKIHITEYYSLLRSIFRESKHSLFSELMDFLAKFNRGIIQTKSKVHDKYIGNIKEFVAPEVANLFGNVSLFVEDMWIIVVDELERSPITETYKVVEMIERFKMEGRNGLPIKMVFFLCLGDEVEGLIKLDENKETRYLVDNFMFESPKSITQRLFLPPIIKSLKYNFIAKAIFDFKKENSITGMPEKEEDLMWGYLNPIKEHLSDVDSIKFIANILVNESPRLIKRCISEAHLFYKSFRNLSGVEMKDAIRFSDILLMSYIKLQHQNLMTFFSKTCEKLYRQSQNEIDPEYLHERLLKDDKKGDNEKTDIKLLKWISNIIKIPHEELAKLSVVNLVAAVSHSYVDRANDIYDVESGISYDGTLSDPARLIDYLVCVSEFVENKRKKYIDLYYQHQNGQLDLSKLENVDLVEYSRILRDIKKAQSKLNLDVATEFCNRIINKKIELLPSIVQRDTILQDAVYQFCFQLLEIVENQRTDKKLKEETVSATKLFVTFLNANNVDTGSKFVVINSFANEERDGSSDIHFRLQRAFEVMVKVDQQSIISAIQNTFNEVDKRYLSGNDVIYEKEENFYYVLYQSWSGKKDNKEELARIHAAAIRGLENHLAVIKLYWQKFPAPLNAQDYDDAVDNDHFFGHETREFNVTLKKLIEVSDKQSVDAFDAEEKRKIALWKKIVNNKEDADKYYQRCALKDKGDTLASFLIRKGYLQNWPPKTSPDTG